MLRARIRQVVAAQRGRRCDYTQRNRQPHYNFQPNVQKKERTFVFPSLDEKQTFMYKPRHKAGGIQKPARPAQKQYAK